MNFLRKKTAEQPATSVGVCLDESHNLVASATVSAETGLLLGRDADPTACARVTAPLPGWSSHTHPVDLKLPRFSPPGETARALIERAERSDAETKKIFGTQQASLVSYDFTRQPERAATYVTIAPAADVRGLSEEASRLLGTGAVVHVEPLTHSVWRAARSALLAALGSPGPDLASHVVAVLIVKRSGYGAAVGTANLFAPGYAIEEPERGGQGLSERSATIAMLTEAVERLKESMLSEATLGVIKAPAGATLWAFVVSDPELWPDLEHTLSKAAREPWSDAQAPAGPSLRSSGFSVIPLRLPADTEESAGDPVVPTDPYSAAAYGAALAALAREDSETEATVNLSEHLRERLRRVEEERFAQQVAETSRRRARALTPLVLLPLVALAVLAALYLGANSESDRLHRQDAAEDARTARLDAYIRRHDAQKKTFAYYQEESKEIFAKRNNQTRVAQLVVDLDRLWPAQDQSWTTTSLRGVKGSNQIEITGRTRQLDAFKSFAKSLEFEPGNTFTNIGPTIGQVSAGGAQGAATASSASASAPAPASGPGVGVYEWRLTANYGAGQQPAPAGAPAPAIPAGAPPQIPQTTAQQGAQVK